MKVELIEQFNMSIGTVLTIKATEVLKIGDKITAGNKDYTIKSFLHPSAKNPDLISVVV